jgi:hypothetical protein
MALSTEQQISRILIGLLALTLAASGQAASPAPLFADDEVIEITIDAPMSTLMDVRPDKAYLKGSLAFTDSGGKARRLQLKLQTRGNYRRDKEHCDFAPIRLNLRKSEVRDTIFADQDRLKLVTHCKSYERDFQELVFREYLAYRLFQAISDISYRTRLLRVTYFDTEDAKELSRYGFVIEDVKAVAKRYGLKRVKERYLAHEDHDRQRQNLVHLFEYMIGNTEYSLVNPEPDKNCCHNMDILSATGAPPYIALPFDFDFSGLVNAPYAEPNPRYPIPNVRVRFYKGLCRNNELLPRNLELFRQKRAELIAIVERTGTISVPARRAAQSAQAYVDGFFEIIDDPRAFKKRLTDACLTPIKDGEPS